MHIGIAADHGGFELKKYIMGELITAGHQIEDYGNTELDTVDDYPDFVAPLARGVAAGEVERGIAVCGSGVGASVAANKVPGARAALITDVFSAHQGVEDDDMNIICMGGRVVGYGLAWDLVQAFICAKYKGEERFQRRLDKVLEIERSG